MRFFLSSAESRLLRSTIARSVLMWPSSLWMISSRPSICGPVVWTVRSKFWVERPIVSKISAACSMARSDWSTLRRKPLYMSSIVFARRISSSRVRSGIDPICERYMRIGSCRSRESLSLEKSIERSRLFASRRLLSSASCTRSTLDSSSFESTASMASDVTTLWGSLSFRCS